MDIHLSFYLSSEFLSNALATPIQLSELLEDPQSYTFFQNAVRQKFVSLCIRLCISLNIIDRSPTPSPELYQVTFLEM